MLELNLHSRVTRRALIGTGLGAVAAALGLGAFYEVTKRTEGIESIQLQLAAGTTITEEQAGSIVDLGIPKDLLPTGAWQYGYGFYPDFIVPNMLVMHITGVNWTRAQQVADYFRSEPLPGGDKRHAGAQFAIGVAGDALQMAESREHGIIQAWAVKNYYYTASIEMTSEYSYHSREDVPPGQWNAAIELALSIMRQYNIPLGSLPSSWRAPDNRVIENLPVGVYGHDQLNPQTRYDPKQVHDDPGTGFLRDFRRELARRLGVISNEWE
jgi:N-acetylmuramoyl-L-alanine amidase